MDQKLNKGLDQVSNNKESRNPLLYDWLKDIHGINRAREHVIMDGKQFWIPFMAIPPPIVKEIFMISEYCDISPNTRYVALYLFDKFMCNHFWEAYTNSIDGIAANLSTWEQICKRISNQSKLRLISCIQIASKIDSHSAGLGIAQVMSILREIDKKQEYTPSTILLSEFKVFKTVGFKIPSGTPLECAEILIAAVELQKAPRIFEIVIHLLDLSFLQHNQLYSNLQLMMNGRNAQTQEEKKNFMVMEINSLYLGGSAVLCAAFLYAWSYESVDELARKLSDLVDIHENDLLIMAKILFTMAVEVDDPIL